MYLSVAQYEVDRDLVEDAYAKVFNRSASIAERQFVQAVGTAESSGGRGWKGAGVDSNNIGAMQATPRNGPCVAGKEPDCDPDTSFVTGDTHEDGTAYRCCYKKYPTRLDGWIDLVRRLYTGKYRNGVTGESIRQAASDSEFMKAVSLQRQSGYFELKLEQYQSKVDLILREMSEVLQEPYSPKVLNEDTLVSLSSVPWLQESPITLAVQKKYNVWARLNGLPIIKEDGVLGTKTAKALVGMTYDRMAR